MNIKTIVFIGVFVGFAGYIGTVSASEFVMSAGYSPIIQDIENYIIGPVTRELNIHDSMLFASSAPSQVKRVGIVREMYVTSTGYNSEEEQTDSTPFIAADGTYVFDGMVAANFLKFGTRIRIPEYYGDKTFYVHDRMHSRFSDRVDIWFEHKTDAIQWGKRKIKIQILEG